MVPSKDKESQQFIPIVFNNIYTIYKRVEEDAGCCPCVCMCIFVCMVVVVVADGHALAVGAVV